MLRILLLSMVRVVVIIMNMMMLVMILCLRWWSPLSVVRVRSCQSYSIAEFLILSAL